MFLNDPTDYVVFSAFGAFFVSLLVGLLLLRFRPQIERFTKDRNDHLAVQASHTGDPLRLGGVAITSGVLFGAATLVTQSAGTFSYLLVASMIPVFVAGLWEDLGHGASARRRFLAAVVAASVAASLLNLWVWRGDLPGLDGIMAVIPLGVFFTVLLAALFCHSVNLIDGMNGLAATVVFLSSLGLANVAAEVDLRQIAVLALLLSAATLGFQLLNWPSALLFLGDAGAYGLGHLLIWLGISTIALSERVAVPAILLILFVPFADTFHTVFRRLLEGKKITVPDRMHLHQKIRRGLEVVWLGRDRRHLSNPLTTIVMLPLTGGTVLAGVLLWDQQVAAWITLVVFSAMFSASHPVITGLTRRYRKKTCLTGPQRHRRSSHRRSGTAPTGSDSSRSVANSKRR